MCKRKVSIIGSTGSIGSNAIKFIQNNKDKYQVVSLTGGSNVELLAKQAIVTQAKYVAIADQNKSDQLAVLLSGSGAQVITGRDAVTHAASINCDVTLAAVVGIAGIASVLESIKNGNILALANKESLVCAGDLIKKQAAIYGTKIIPVDSEHSAIFQVFDNANRATIDKIILTASGGPFLHKTQQEIEKATIEETLKHPRWAMGNKISVDSATLMNKALEVIEAYHLFAMEGEKIDVIVHPESIIHSMVSYIDGSVLAQLSVTDMQIPISLALSWPHRTATYEQNMKLDLVQLASLSFCKLDDNKFPAILLAKEALRKKNSTHVALNVANEIAVEAFLQGRIGFNTIYNAVATIFASAESYDVRDLQDVLELNRQYSALTRDLLHCD